MIGWIYAPISRFIKDIPRHRLQNPHVVRTFAIRLSLTLLVAGVCLTGIKWKPNVLIPAVITYDKQFSVRTTAPGFIKEVFVEQGQQVKEGEALFRLSNIELEHDLKLISLELDNLNLQMRKADAEGQVGQLQILGKKMEPLEERRQILEEDLQNLSILSPGNGVIVGRNLEKYIGLWSNAGRELCQVVSADHTRLVASVSQDDISSFSFDEGDTVRVDMNDAGQGVFDGQVERVSPTASKDLVHFALAAPYGGALDVVAAQENGRSQYELLEPRFSVYIGLPREKADRVKDGQRAFLLESTGQRSLGRLFSSAISSWIDGKKGN